MSDRRETLTKALTGHRYDTVSQDSGKQCICGSDSRFEQRGGDLPWETFEEHLADVALNALSVPEESDLSAIERMLRYIRDKGYNPKLLLDPPREPYDKTRRTAAYLDEAITKLTHRRIGSEP